MTQTHLPTISAISALRDEAIAAGDTDQARVCTAALDGYTDAIIECARVVDGARARGGGADALARAIQHLDAAPAGVGYSYVSRDEGRAMRYTVSAEDMADLGRRLRAGEEDAYSRWCSETVCARSEV